jgi:hypothetical protein
MKDLKEHELEGFLSEERKDCYYFWFKGKVTRMKNRDSGEIYVQTLAGRREWNGIRLKNAFYNMLDILSTKYTMSGKWNGQSKAEFEKNFKRVADIQEKAAGDAGQPASSQDNRRMEGDQPSDGGQARRLRAYIRGVLPEGIRARLRVEAGV